MRNPFPILFNLFKSENTGKLAPVNQDDLENSILLAMLYIARNIKESGRFVYRNSTNQNKKYSDKYYSSLRHAGTLYSMYLCEKLLDKFALQNKRFLASEYFIKNYVKKVDNDMYGVVSKPVEEAPELLATSGGTGLGLIALSNLLTEKRVSAHTLKKMGNFLLFMQNEKGDFAPSFLLGSKQKSDLHAARYYPGESCLGLLYLYEVDKDEKWLNAAKKGIIRLAERASVKKFDEMKFDHWGLLASQKLFQTSDNGLNAPQKALITAFVEKNVKLVIAKQDLNTRGAHFGSFNGTKTLCGIGTILEGLIAAADCTRDKVIQKKMSYSIKSGVEYLCKYQVKTGEMEGGIPTSFSWNTPEAKNADKEIRIDNVQHVLSAWAAYKKMLI